MAANLPEIVYRYPTLSNEPQASLTPSIVFDWSVDMNTTQFSNDALRAANLILLNDETSEVIPTTYVSYTAAQKRFTIQPASGLLANNQYRIIIKNKLVSTDGRKSSNEYNWVFLTASGTVTEVTLLSPGDGTVQAVGPQLNWQTISYVGSASSLLTVNYLVQLSSRFDFGTVNFSTTTTAASATPDYNLLADNTTYYWRVLPYTVEATGFWSDTRSFYYGRSLYPDETTRQYLPDPVVFDVKRLGFKNYLSNQTTFPTPLSINFTAIPASDFATYITVRRKSVLPRNDVESSFDEVACSGSWALSASTITWTFGEAIANNTRYEIILLSEMKSSNSLELGTDYAFWFTSKYTPFYVTSRSIRARFLGAEQKVPDDLINFYIHQASLEANARFWSYGTVDPYMGDSLSETMVRDSGRLTSHGVLKWVEANAAYKVVKAILFEHLRDIGRTERLGDSLVSLTKDFVAGIDKALELIKEELDQWDDYLTPSSMPTTVSKTSGWSPIAWDYDISIRDLEGRRDSNFGCD